MLVEYVPEALERLDDWVNRLASTLPPPERRSIGEGDFVWAHPGETPEVLLVCKSVRLASAFASAWRLAGDGLTTEAGAICRLIDDFSSEIWFVGRMVLTGESNRAQRRFVSAYFEPMPRDLESFLKQEKAHYVSRGEILKVQRRASEDAGVDAEALDNLSRFISYGLNGYTHGTYSSTMELYHGGTGRFDVLGIQAGRPRESSIQFVANKGTEACHGVELAAMSLGLIDVRREIARFLGKADPG